MVVEQVFPVVTSEKLVTVVVPPEHPVMEANGGQFEVPSGILQAAQSPVISAGIVNVVVIVLTKFTV